jgi:cysteinyl-tRNA synthetase
MAERFLGIPVDLHGGAPDLIYPHHYAENEVALALDGSTFARVFLHTGFVLVGGAKMSKSTGVLIPLRTALEDVGAGSLRWYLLSTSFTERLQWDPVALHRAAREFEGLRTAVRTWLGPTAAGRGTAASIHRLSEGVRRDLAEGLATDRAFARLGSWAVRTREQPTGGVASRDRAAARREFRSIEERTGLSLL